MMISSSDIQQRRSPQALRDFVIELDNAVRADKAEHQSGMLKKGLYKEFLDEMVPLRIFVQNFYPGNYEIQPILGNQGYDALVFDEKGIEVDRVEMTTPHDGSYDAKDAKLVVERGYGEVKIGTPGDDFDALFPFVLSICQKKAIRDYKDCTLVVSISPMPPFESFKKKYDDQISSLSSKMAEIRFNAKRVFLLILPDRIVKIY
jgi:hypothetical protein